MVCEWRRSQNIRTFPSYNIIYIVHIIINVVQSCSSVRSIPNVYLFFFSLSRRGRLMSLEFGISA